MRLLLLPCALAALACSRGTPGPPAAGSVPAAGDSLRGIVEVVGSEPGTSVALLMDGPMPSPAMSVTGVGM